MKKLIYLLFITLLLACSNQEKKLPENFDFGKTEKGTYVNDYFEMKVSFNPAWIVQDKQEMNKLVEFGQEFIVGDNEDLKRGIKASHVNTAYLLAVFKHEIGAAVEYNPSLVITAENTKNAPGIKNGQDYLFHVKKGLEQTALTYSFEKEVFEREIGNSLFHVMETQLDFMGKTIIQEYLTTVYKDFSLSFIISYTNEEEKKELYEVLDHISI